MGSVAELSESIVIVDMSPILGDVSSSISTVPRSIGKVYISPSMSTVNAGWAVVPPAALIC